jgi:hypothetical protein
MTPDNNLISFNGPHHNGLTVEHPDLILPTPQTTDTLKFSTELTGFRGIFGRVYSGTEDAVDINNRCHDIVLGFDTVVLGGKMGITIKGGSKNIGITIRNLVGRGQEVDVDIGNWSDQSHEPVTGVYLDIRRADGSPVTVRVINGEKPLLAPGSGPYKFIFPQPWIPLSLRAKVFQQLRRSGLFR